MTRFEKILLSAVVLSVVAIATTYVLDRSAKLWSNMTPGQGEFLGLILSAIMFLGGLAIAILILKHQVAQEDRRFAREKAHRVQIAARAYLPPVEKLAFGAIQIVKIWADVQGDCLNKNYGPVQDHNMLSLPSSAFQVTWPQIPDDDVAGLPLHIAQAIFSLKANAEGFHQYEEKPNSDLDSLRMRAVSHLTLIASALNLRVHLLAYLGAISEEDQHSLDARAAINSAIEVSEKMHKKYIDELLKK